MFAGGIHPSFEMAAKAVEKLAGVKISDRQLGRITEEIGTEMIRQRDLKTARHQERTLPVAVAGIPSLAVVEIDGGRYLARDPAAGTGPGAHGVGWKEDKAACLVTMTGTAFDQDPHPDLPTCFTDKKSVAKLVKGLTSQGSLSELADASGGDETAELTVVTATDAPTTPPEWPPKPLVRTSIATTRDCDALGPMVAAEAHARNFDRARARSSWATVANGSGEFRRSTFRSTRRSSILFMHCLTFIWRRKRFARHRMSTGRPTCGGPAAVGRGTSKR